MRIFYGTIEHIQVSSPQLGRKVRKRFQADIDQLTSLGFDYKFSDGEGFSVFRLFLIFPALIQLVKLCHREVMTVAAGARLLTVRPIYASKDGTTYAHPLGLGTKFQTSFDDGTILLTKNFGDLTGYSQVVVGQALEHASVNATWLMHQRWIGELEAQGKRVDNPIGYEAYARISHRESATHP